MVRGSCCHNEHIPRRFLRHTFDTDSFVKKVIGDLGQIASGQAGRHVNLIPAMPGMRIISTLQKGSQSLAQEGVAFTLINLEDLSFLATLPGNDDFEMRLGAAQDA